MSVTHHTDKNGASTSAIDVAVDAADNEPVTIHVGDRVFNGGIVQSGRVRRTLPSFTDTFSVHSGRDGRLLYAEEPAASPPKPRRKKEGDTDV